MYSSGSVELPDWVLSLCVSEETKTIFASTSKGSLHSVPLDASKWNLSPLSGNTSAHNKPVNKILTDPSSPNTLYSCSEDSTVKVWDVRTPFTKPQFTLTNSRNLPFFSMDIGHGLVSAGSQLKGTDSELVLWDTRKLDTALRSFIDSHNDDITATKFHPTRKNLLLSGATDGYVNVYDLNIVDEDDAQLQCINFSSVHSAGFTSQDRVYVLSHMETFAIFDLSTEQDLDPDANSPGQTTPIKRGDVDFGDIREKWDCEYVVDFYAPGFIGCGSNSKSSAKLFQVDPYNEIFDPKQAKSWVLDGAHGEEVVRDMAAFDNRIYTAGEDNVVRVWNGEDLPDFRRSFFDDEETDASAEPVVNEERMDVEYDVRKKKRHEDKKEKKHKKHKKDSSNRKHRFKPY